MMMGAVIMFVYAATLIRSLPEKVDASFRNLAETSADPEVMLNHANTYYWWGRYRKNTLPEFDTAAKMATQALQLAEARMKIDGDTGRFHTIERQATQIINLSREQAYICRYNLSTYVPAFMEIMGHDQAYMQEDADGEDVPFIALRGAIGRLTELLSPNRNQTIGSLSHFTLLNVKTYNPLAEEMLVQELNNSTRMYTISRHELSGIIGLDSIKINELLGDSLAMIRIAHAYNTDELAVIDFQENDRVNGIYYYGMRLRFWNVDRGWQSRNVYTEFMTRDRVFNQLSGFILPFFLAFLLAAFALNLFLNILTIGRKTWSSISLIHLPLSFLIATIVQYALVTFVLKNFLNPAPEDYFVSDDGELWVIAYPLTFILPAFITYIFLGKMDNFIPRFHSDLENPAALFALVSGTLLTIPYAFTYNQVLRFGNGVEVSSLFPFIGLLTAISLLISRHWATIINFPARVQPLHRLSTWLALAIYIWLVFSLISDLQLHYDTVHLEDWLRVEMIPAILISESVHYLIRRLIRPGLKQLSRDEKVPPPIGLDDFELTYLSEELYLRKRSSGFLAASLYVKSERKMPVGPALETLFSMQERQISIRIDFSTVLTSQEVHYPAFADGFEYYLPTVKFNDATETARKTSNLLGRLISALSSVGGVMIDDRPVQGRNPNELARLILDIPWSEPGIWFFDHVEIMKEEDLVLIEHLIREIRDRRSNKPHITNNNAGHYKLPMIICCGYGEFGLRDRLLAALALLESEGVFGFHEYTVKYDQPAKLMLAKENFPIQLRLHLESLFRRERQDHIPGYISETIFMLRKRGKFMDDPEMPFTLAAIDQMVSLPDIDGDKSIISLDKLEPRIQQVMIAAAYISDEHGHFHLPVLAHIEKMDRMHLLQLLKEAEIQNLIYDLKDIEQFYWYAFTDRTIIADLKKIDNSRLEEVSQFAYECYRGFVEYHLSDQHVSEMVVRLRHSYHQAILNTESIILLALRAYAVRPLFPWIAFQINHAAAMILSEPGIARYEEALQCVERALDLMSIVEVRNQAAIGSMVFDIKILRFKLWLEIGRIQHSDADYWLDDIKKDEHFIVQSKDDRIQFLLTEIRFRFTRFSSKHNDESKGNDLCEEMLSSQLSEEYKHWIRFYKIKLIPSNKYKPGSDGWVIEAIRVNRLYRELLKELDDCLRSSEKHLELYRQLLNDYGGSFLGDKILPMTYQLNQTEDVNILLSMIRQETHEDLLMYIESILSKRIDLELQKTGESNNYPDPLTKEPLMKLLMNEDPSIDKRGVCYTLNYLSRAYLTCGLTRQCIDIGELAYRFNTLIGDKTGCCLAAGTIAYAYEQVSDAMNAFEWFERSFGHGWEIGHWSTLTMALQSYRMANSYSNPALLIRSKAYLRQIAIRALIPFFPNSSATDALAHQLMSSCLSIKKLMSVDQVDAFLGVSLEAFLNKSNPRSFEYWKDEVLKKGEDKGFDKALWINEENMTFNWEASVIPTAYNHIERIQLSLIPVITEIKYDFILHRISGTEHWFISSLSISK